MQDQPLEKPEIGHIKSRKIVEEMKVSYLDYAMSIIVSRALPDVRDGLKPSQRRILYAMHNLGLNHSVRYRKSALVVGDVLGKYHPHGDMAVYDTMVRLAQDFSLRYPLIDGQGNFGSVDGDSAAQMRYTECRMTAMAEGLLKDIDKETINFVDNYDASRKEPVVLPGGIPQLLVNGAMGIAVGMATNIPPHNLGEVVDALVLLINNPDAEILDIMKFIKGPDFPTGGSAYSRKDILEAYSTGRGRVITRAKCEIVETRKGFSIIVSEIAYQTNKANTIAKIAALVKDGKLKGIRDIRDESDKDGIRVVIELRKDAYPQKVLNRLYQLTDFQKNFGYNMLALEGGIQPRVMNVKEMLSFYLDHRIEVVTKRTEYELRKAKERAHILEGLKKAIDNIDEVIAIIRASSSRQTAHKNLMGKFKFSDAQTVAILDMRLQTLAGLERKKIENELKEKLKLIKELEELLKSEEKIKGVVRDELMEVKEKFNNPRRTRIIAAGVNEFSNEDLIPAEDSIVMISKGGYIKRMDPNNYRVQRRGGVGIIGASMKEDDVITHIFSANTHDDIYFFSESGKVYMNKTHEIPEASRLSKGQAIVNFLSLPPREKITAVLPVSAKAEEGRDKPSYLFMATKKGTIKRVKLSDLANIRKSGINVIRLNEDDELWWVKPTSGKDEIILVTALGQSIRFKEADARVMGRAAAGVTGIRMKAEDKIIGMIEIWGGESKDKQLLVITEKGYGKKTDLSKYKIQKRGGTGIKTIKISSRNGEITHASLLKSGTHEVDIIATSCNGNIIRINTKGIPKLGRVTQGVRIMKLRKDDKVAQATKL